jgi:hypothetical protein
MELLTRRELFQLAFGGLVPDGESTMSAKDKEQDQRLSTVEQLVTTVADVMDNNTIIFDARITRLEGLVWEVEPPKGEKTKV